MYTADGLKELNPNACAASLFLLKGLLRKRRFMLHACRRLCETPVYDCLSRVENRSFFFFIKNANTRILQS